MKMTREEYDKVKQEYSEDQQNQQKQKQKKKVKIFGWGKRNLMNKSIKKPEMIVVFLLNQKREIEGPILTKIYGGNFLVIRNRIYRFNPNRVFTMGKYKVVVAREFDRELIGIDDYDKLVKEDFASQTPGSRVNIDDPVLIKAVIAAHLSEKAPKTSSKWIIIVLVILGIIVGFFFLTGKK